MTRYRAVTIREYGVDYRDFKNAESAEAYDLWIHEEYPTTKDVSLGDINGDEYVVVYYLKGEKE